ncbi:MAG: amidohydrolase family protein [Nitrospirae bacterium]|nr:amidohydrolase family protein [Nitrospirota bacterium]
MDENPSLIKDGGVVVSGSKIVEVGSFKELSKNYKPKKIIGGKGKAVLPGLINTHTHAAMVLMRGMADDISLKEWLERHIWPSEQKWLSPSFISDAVSLACLEMLKAGITTYNDMYFYEHVSANTAKKMGMRAVLGSGILDFPTKTAGSVEEYLKNAEEFIKAWKDDELITPCVAPHAVYTCNLETLKKAFLLSEKYDTLIHIHLSETRWEVAESLKRYGKTPGMLLEGLGILSRRLLAVHCIWLSDEEIEVFAKRGVGVSHCIESNLKLASGVAPVPKMLKAGIKVTFGTDGAASNNDLNIFSEMSTAAKLHKSVSDDPTTLPAKTVIKMATRWAGEALGLGGIIGSLEKGKSADLIVVDLLRPHLTPVYNIFSHIVYSMRPSDVETVMVNGKLVVDKGRLLTGDEEEILNKAGRWGERIKKG